MSTLHKRAHSIHGNKLDSHNESSLDAAAGAANNYMYNGEIVIGDMGPLLSTQWFMLVTLCFHMTHFV